MFTTIYIVFVYFLLFFIGASFGSFMGVLNDRLTSDGEIKLKNILGRSRCDSCQKVLGITQLFPIFSIIFSRFKCSKCKSPIPYRYIVYEIVVGLIFLGTFILTINNNFLNLESYFNFIFIVFNLCLLYLIFLADYKFQVIPDIYVLVGAVFTIIFNISLTTYQLVNLYLQLKYNPLGKYLIKVGFFQDQAIYYLTPLLYTILGAIVIYLFFYFLYAITKGRGMGGGDVKLSFYIAVFLGFPNMLIGTFLAFILGAVFGVSLILANKKHFGEKIAFGPFIVVATVITYFLGDYIWLWYTNLL